MCAQRLSSPYSVARCTNTQGFDPSPMSRAEAAKILGISSSAKKEDVAKVHRKLMILNHPDRGGSPFLAAKVNEAKQVPAGSMPSRSPACRRTRRCSVTLTMTRPKQVLTGTNQHSNPFR